MQSPGNSLIGKFNSLFRQKISLFRDRTGNRSQPIEIASRICGRAFQNGPKGPQIREIPC
jgi:hypothetical protein